MHLHNIILNLKQIFKLLINNKKRNIKNQIYQTQIQKHQTNYN